MELIYNLSATCSYTLCLSQTLAETYLEILGFAWPTLSWMMSAFCLDITYFKAYLT